MATAEIISLLITILKEAPEAISVVEQSIELFKSNTITQDQMVALWQSAGNSVKAAEVKWRAAGAQ